ncbi:hypothetical protein CNBB4380 [Cryptococcus deneoformans B-3501A]|uniref:Expressed protein n=1 Tax=Cryptococcus deneoformans (strain JEC21 / ATCC MYA-565) TaxID=214684 RepID=Q5KMK9_CRYD1|nr:expressed protein [Cryptococcus neoformans var. neoformans JEC21]XP_777208.1 hypothetical protein CNBB4380 [Cryptococcus neoformans var. neoformans B-3501A]AAW41499.1 expressed protein [Cryptococcus neoformans var. neoformans JEC21]EAL22561.1 hypothetical protein CNBB4380 [Cryptococcus neoformans var. neoformans B-3501A]
MINISYYTLPLVHLQTLGASIRFATRRLGFRNNVNPRQVLDDMEKSGKVKPKTLEKLRRRQAAHENCFENEAIFIGAVIAGNQVGLSTKYMNIMSVSYFLLRCIYIWMYINFADQKKSYWRTIVYWTSNFCFLTTFVKCGLKLNAGD